MEVTAVIQRDKWWWWWRHDGRLCSTFLQVFFPADTISLLLLFRVVQLLEEVVVL